MVDSLVNFFYYNLAKINLFKAYRDNISFKNPT